MDFFRIECFLKAAESGNMTRAAELMNITQPAMSFQIRELEKEVRLTLFDRNRNGIYLTEAGKIMRDGFIRILDSYERLLDDARACAFGRERLTIGFHGPVNWAGISGFVAAFSNRHPEIDVVLLQQQWRELAEYLELGALDAAFLESAELSGRKTLSSHPLFQENACFAVALSHPLAEKTAITSDDLSDEIILMNNHPSESMASLIRRLERSGVRPEQFRFFDEPNITLSMAAAGQGLAAIPESFRYDTGALRYLEPESDPCRIDYSIAWKGSNENRALRLFIDELLRVSWPFSESEPM